MIPHIISIFSKSEAYFNEIFIPNLNDGTGNRLKTAISISRPILCTSYCDYIKIICLDDTGQLAVQIQCEKCDIGIKNSSEKLEILKQFKKQIQSQGRSIILNFCHNKFDVGSLSNDILRKSMAVLQNKEVSLKIASLQILPSVASHSRMFISTDIVKIWLEKLEDNDPGVRGMLARNIGVILKNSEVNRNHYILDYVSHKFSFRKILQCLRMIKKSISMKF